MTKENIFSQRLTQLIVVLGASKKNFASVLRVSPSYITKLTTPPGKEPSASFVKLVAMTFGVSEQWLTGELENDAMFGPEVSHDGLNGAVADLRRKYRHMRIADANVQALDEGPWTIQESEPSSRGSSFAVPEIINKIANLTNIQKEWLAVGLDMTETEMLEWLLAIKKKQQENPEQRG